MARTLAQLTTLRVGGPIGRLVRAQSEAELIEAVRDNPDVLVIGGGSNLVAGDEGFSGTVVQDGRHEIEVVESSGCGGIVVRATAGVTWDAFVAHAIDSEWTGVEALSGIPGTVGAAPVQNIGAYGQEVAQTLAAVRVYDRDQDEVRRLAFADLKFGYRDSILKRSQIASGQAMGRWVVLEVEFQFKPASLSQQIRYAELARYLGVDVGARVPLTEVRQGVLDLRRRKGMVLDPEDHDTWSAGSFFTNPILSEGKVPEGAPAYPVRKGEVKTSAAWLITHAGVERGWGLSPRATVSTKHSLALTNRGGATSADILTLAHGVQARVLDAFGVNLVPEPVFVGCQW